MLRWLKILLVLFVALQGLFHALQNLANLEAARGFVAAVLTRADQAAYPNTFAFGLESPALIGAALWTVIAGELLVGLLGLKGVWDMARARGPAFEAAKLYGLLACGLALLVWFGLFLVIGGGFFQMWQTELGSASMEGAFQFAAMSGIVMLFVAMPEREALPRA